MGRPKAPPAVVWVCSKCKNTLRTFVRLSEPPKCSGGSKHPTIPMEAVDGK